MDNFPKILKELRTSKSWSQADLSKKIGVSQPTIADYEKGTKNPSLDTFNKLARVFSVSLEYLRGDKMEKGPYLSTDEIDIKDVYDMVRTRKLTCDGRELHPLEAEIIRRYLQCAVEREEDLLKHKGLKP